MNSVTLSSFGYHNINLIFDCIHNYITGDTHSHCGYLQWCRLESLHSEHMKQFSSLPGVCIKWLDLVITNTASQCTCCINLATCINLFSFLPNSTNVYTITVFSYELKYLFELPVPPHSCHFCSDGQYKKISSLI